MSGFNRGAFKGAKLSSIKEEKKQAEAKSNVTNSSGRANFLTIDNGENVFRILPPHKQDEPPYRALRTAWLDCQVPEYDDSGNLTGKDVIKRKRIFIATVHGVDKEGNPMRNDPVEAYIKYAWKNANDMYTSKDDRKGYMSPINGYMDKKGKFIPGIAPSTNYVFYAVKDGVIGRLELYKSMVDVMEQYNISADDADNPLETDIFSDPDEGVSLTITYNEKGERGKKYIVGKREITKKFKTVQEFYESERVSDEILQELQTKDSLTDLYVNVYSLKDFDLAVDGLKRFDAEHKFGIFDNSDFINELSEIKNMLPKQDQAPIKAKEYVESKSIVESKPISIEDKVQSMSKFDCNKFLKAYVLENYGEEKPLPSDLKVLREWVLLAMQEEELPFVDDVDDEDQSFVQEQNPADTEGAQDEISARLAELRRKL